MTGQRRTRDWQKTDPHIRSHPSFRKFRAKLGISAPLAHGLLAGLFAFAFDFARDGDLSRFTPDDVAIGIEYDGDPEELWRALDGGFLKKGVINDWYEWGGAKFGDQIKDAHRKYDQYHAEQGSSSTEEAGGNRRMPQKRREEKREEKEQDLKEHVQTLDLEVVPKDDGFADFYAAYPRREKRKDAARAWKKLTVEQRRLATGVAALMTNLVAQGLGPEKKNYIPLPTTFLNGERWEDWREGAPAAWCDTGGNGKQAEREASIQRAMARFQDEREVPDAPR